MRTDRPLFREWSDLAESDRNERSLRNYRQSAADERRARADLHRYLRSLRGLTE